MGKKYKSGKKTRLKKFLIEFDNDVSLSWPLWNLYFYNMVAMKLHNFIVRTT